AEEIAQALAAETLSLRAPPIRAPVLDRQGHRARSGARAHALLRAIGSVIVQDRLPLARADVEPAVRAAESGERVAESRRQGLGVAREAAVDDVAPGNRGAPAAVDLFLLEKFLVDLGRRNFLGRGGFQPEQLGEDERHTGRAGCSGIPLS